MHAKGLLTKVCPNSGAPTKGVGTKLVFVSHALRTYTPTDLVSCCVLLRVLRPIGVRGTELVLELPLGVCRNYSGSPESDRWLGHCQPHRVSSNQSSLTSLHRQLSVSL
jgi:hypothetical protein